jgi:hypothetical protein
MGKVGRGLLVIICILTQRSYSQTSLEDSLHQQLKKDSAHIFRKTFAKPYLRIENRTTFLSNRRVALPGIMGGITFIDKHTFALGYYTLWNRKPPFKFVVQHIQPDQFLEMNYYTFSYLYVLLSRKFFQVNPLVEIGYGEYNVETRNANGSAIGSTKGKIIPYGGGVQFIYKPIRWAGASVLGGYRFEDSDPVDFTINGWFYTLGVWIDARYLFRSAKYQLVKKRYRSILKTST